MNQETVGTFLFASGFVFGWRIFLCLFLCFDEILLKIYYHYHLGLLPFGNNASWLVGLDRYTFLVMQFKFMQQSCFNWGGGVDKVWMINSVGSKV